MMVYTSIYQRKEKMFIYDVCAALEEAEIPYAIVGRVL